MISFLYKNKIKSALSIESNSFTNGFEPAQICDDNINSPFRSSNDSLGTTTILFTFGSSVYIDSVACVSNINLTGTLILRAGNNSNVSNFSINIPLDGLGTSYKYIGNMGYQYWRLDCFGATGIIKHQINELFLGKRKLITEMPSYPVETGIEEDNIELVSERGHRWIYNNFNREYWVFNFEGVNSSTESDLYNMYKFCGKSTIPFWMILDDTNVMDIKFCRFRDKSFLSNQITKQVFDVTLEIGREI